MYPTTISFVPLRNITVSSGELFSMEKLHAKFPILFLYRKGCLLLKWKEYQKTLERNYILKLQNSLFYPVEDINRSRAKKVKLIFHVQEFKLWVYSKENVFF